MGETELHFAVPWRPRYFRDRFLLRGVGPVLTELGIQQWFYTWGVPRGSPKGASVLDIHVPKTILLPQELRAKLRLRLIKCAKPYSVRYIRRPHFDPMRRSYVYGGKEGVRIWEDCSILDTQFATQLLRDLRRYPRWHLAMSSLLLLTRSLLKPSERLAAIKLWISRFAETLHIPSQVLDVQTNSLLRNQPELGRVIAKIKHDPGCGPLLSAPIYQHYAQKFAAIGKRLMVSSLSFTSQHPRIFVIFKHYIHNHMLRLGIWNTEELLLENLIVRRMT